MLYSLLLTGAIGLVLATPAVLSAAPKTTIEWKGIPDDPTLASDNTVLLNEALASLSPGTVLNIPNNTYWLSGGVLASGLVDVTIELDGTFRFSDGRESWPTEDCSKNGEEKQCVKKAMLIEDARGLTLTTSDGGRGTVDGNGESWWGYINYLIHGEDRPKLLTIQNSTDVLVERWHFRQSAYHTFHADDVARVEIRHCSVDNRVNDDDSHGPVNLGAFNTDGFDVSGRDIHIHDCTVWNQDDCFTIVPTTSKGINSQCTENILVENVEASGLGLTVGSIKPTPDHACIKNVTFRNAYMHHTFKGIYMKSASSTITDQEISAEITDILYENITMDTPEQVPIWIGPAQEGDSSNACSLVWPTVKRAKCPAPLPSVTWSNIVLRDIFVRGSKVSPGLVFGNEDNPMDVVFDNVVFDSADEDAKPWGEDFYYCKGVQGIAKGGTSPVPPCFGTE
jgi:polygalacturonase